MKKGAGETGKRSEKIFAKANGHTFTLEWRTGHKLRYGMLSVNVWTSSRVLFHGMFSLN